MKLTPFGRLSQKCNSNHIKKLKVEFKRVNEILKSKQPPDKYNIKTERRNISATTHQKK